MATIEQRQNALAERVALLARDGWRPESQTQTQATLVKGKRPNHVLHLILTIITAGLWGIVWIILAITKHEKRMLLTISEDGSLNSTFVK